MKPVVIHSEAKAELDQAIGFYEARKEGLGAELQCEVEDTIAKIQANPALGSPYKSTEIRFFLVHRFPFVVYYTETTEVIWVFAIAHGRQKPGYWRRRKIE
jgi:toxin ParE1/3/4